MGRVHRSGTVTLAKKAAKRHARNCRSAPKVPTGITVTFVKNENRSRAFWNARVKWNDVTEDVSGRALSVEAFQVQLRATDASGVPVQLDGVDHDFWRQRIEADEDRRAVFRDIPRPKTFYYQARVRTMNRHHGTRCWSAWSPWTTPIQPVTGALTGPPAPTGVILRLDKVEGVRKNPWRAKVRWNEVPQWTPPDDDPVEGAAGYHVQLAVSNNGGTTTANVRRKTVEADDSDANVYANANFGWNIRGRRHYRARVKAYDVDGRRGAWSSWTPWASPGGEPDPPTNVTWSNPIPRLLVAKWDEPADLTDVDRYRVQVLRQPGPVVVDTGYTAGTRWVYHIPFADRDNAHRVRVKSIEDPVILDVDEDVATGWDTATESTQVDSPDLTATETWTSDEAPASDGIPPSVSPVPTVQGAISFLAVTWTAITNSDTVTYEVHVSTTSGFTPSAATKSGEGGLTFWIIRTMPNGSALTYGTTYYVKLIAKDRDGAAAAGAQGSGSLVQINSPDIAANAVITNLLAAGAVIASKIDVDELSAISADLGTVTAGTYKTAPSGTRWEISSAIANQIDGIVATNDNGGYFQIADSELTLVGPFDTGQSQGVITLIAGTFPVGGVVLGGGGSLFINTAESQLINNQQARGYVSHRAFNYGAAGRDHGVGTTYGGVTTLTNVPSSITLNTVGTDTGVSGVGATEISIRGFRFEFTVAPGVTGKATRHYVTVGN